MQFSLANTSLSITIAESTSGILPSFHGASQPDEHPMQMRFKNNYISSPLLPLRDALSIKSSIMSAKTLYWPQLALGNVRKCPTLSRYVFQRARPAHRRSYVSAQEEGRSFKGQLYESTAQRLQRERAEQARFAKQRELGSGGKSASLLFGMDTKF